MKKIILVLLLIVGVLNAASFTVDDPPMFYIFNFVTYDKTILIDPNIKNNLLEIPLVNEKVLDTQNNLLLKEELNPKLLSAMVTTAISEYPQVKIAGESIQKRIKNDYIMDILSSYDYSDETDYIFIGEINTLAQQFEIDLKIIDVSQQIIQNSKSFQIPFETIANLRSEITKYVRTIMDEFLVPFTGTVCLHTDSIGITEIQQEMIVIRSVSSKVGSSKSLNTDKDFKRFKLKELDSMHEEYYAQYLNKFPNDDFKIIIANEINYCQFLEGDYIARIYLKDNEGFYETAFTVKPGMINEIKYLPKRKIIPKKVLPKNGRLTISNIQDFTVVGILDQSNSLDVKYVCGLYDGETIYNGNSDILVNWSNENNECEIVNLPFGSYKIFAYNISKEIFPGKADVDYLRFENFIELDKNEHEKTVNIKNGTVKGNKSIIIYFNPFPEFPDELYEIYFSDSYIPITVVEKAGELHIYNLPDSLKSDIHVFREGYIEAVLPLEENINKQYFYANLSVREEGQKLSKSIGDTGTEFYQKIDEPEEAEEQPLVTGEQVQQKDISTKDDLSQQLEPELPSVPEKDIFIKDDLSQELEPELPSVTEKGISSTFQSLRAFLSGGLAQTGLMGQTPGSYTHNPVKAGFNIKIGARKSLSDFFELPEYLPLTAQIGLGFQMNQAMNFLTEDLMAITLNIDVLYNLDEIDDTPYIDFNPFLGVKFDAQIYETFSAYLLGLQLGMMVDYDLSDLVIEGLVVELTIAQSFDFDVSGNASPFLAMTYMDLGVSYAFEF
jgi:hypothetical protein